MSYFKRPEFELRQSQLLTPFGVGSLLDINNQSIMVADTEYWDEMQLNEIHDIRLEKVLETDGFVEPPLKEDSGEYSKIYAKRFPKWYFSPETRELKRIEEWQQEIASKLKNNRFLKEKFITNPFTFSTRNKSNTIELVPVRILCACSHGHIQDFPWLEWAHQGEVISHSEEKKHKLKLTSSGKSSGLNELRVECSTCETRYSLGKVLDEKYMDKNSTRIGFECEGKYVWKKGEAQKKCSETPKVLFRNATSLYFPKIVSSVIVPFNENSLIEEIIKMPRYKVIKEILDEVDDVLRYELFITDEEINLNIKKIASLLNEEVDQVRDVVAEKFGFEDGTRNQTIGMMEYRKDEYAVLTGVQSYNKKSSIDFDIKIIPKEELINNSSRLSGLFNKITLVNSLEVLSALTGYTRINSLDTEEITTSNRDEKEHVISLRRRDNRFLGVKSKGEGFFLEFDSTEIKKWSEKIKKSMIYREIVNKKKAGNSDPADKLIEPEYYLIHTLSHLLIRELTLNSGYSSSSIRERIYFSKDEKEMFGILLYTSSSDSEGTLGGLVKQGVPSNIFGILESALQKAKWCSFDPVCIESNGQGRDSMNLAACHACALVSETSCEKMNSLLDRKTLVGSWHEPELGFFTPYLD